jgi:hypothetical protein
MEEAQVFEPTWTIPPAADIPISQINMVLFASRTADQT